MGKHTRRRLGFLRPCDECGREFQPWGHQQRCCCRSCARTKQWRESRTLKRFMRFVHVCSDGHWLYGGYLEHRPHRKFGRVAWGRPSQDNPGHGGPYTAAQVAWSLVRNVPIADVPRLRIACGSDECCNPAHLIPSAPARLVAREQKATA
jgi:hypothetical protein